MTLCRLLALSAIAIILLARNDALAQGAFPAPLPGQTSQPPANGNMPSAPITPAPPHPFPLAGAPPVAGTATPSASAIPDECEKQYRSLWAETSQRGQLIKAASEQHAPLNEACDLMNSYGRAEIRLIEYVESHATTCGFTADFRDQLKNSRKNADAVQKRACASLQPKPEPGGPAGDFVPPSTTPPG